MTKYPDEYDREICPLTGGTCDNECPYFGDCPIEEFDVAQGKFVKRVIDIIKEDKQ